MIRTCALAMTLLLTGCGLATTSADAPPTSRVIKVTNQYRTPVDIFARLGRTVIQRRLARVPPGRTTHVRMPSAYFRASELSLEVCRVDGILGEQNCVSTNRYEGLDFIPELVIRASERFSAELYGE